MTATTSTVAARKGYEQACMSKIEAIRFVNTYYMSGALESNFVNDLLVCTDDDKTFSASQIIAALDKENEW
jgi:hypothetical protein